jgi:hypothetical protein
MRMDATIVRMDGTIVLETHRGGHECHTSYVNVNMYVHVCVCMYIYIYIYIYSSRKKLTASQENERNDP